MTAVTVCCAKGYTLKGFLAEIDAHLSAYGHDMTWTAGKASFGGVCERCSGAAVVRLDGAGVLRVHGDPKLVPRYGDFTECAALIKGPGRPRVSA